MPKIAPLLGLLVATSLGVPAPAAAQTSPARDMRAEMLGYYHGEQVSAYVIGGIGLAGAGTGAYLVTRDGDFERGLGWSMIALGGLEVIGALAYALSVDSEIDHYDALLSEDPSAFREEEIAHIEGTASRFVYYRLIEGGLVAVGLAMVVYGLLAERDAWTGAGLGIASLALPIFVIDTINNARAQSYLDTLRRFEPSVSASTDALHITLGGRF